MLTTAEVAFAFKVFPSLTKSRVSQRARLHFFIPANSLLGRLDFIVGAGGNFEQINFCHKLGGRLYATSGGFSNVCFK